MITFEDAYRIVMDAVEPLETQTVSLADSLGRVLAQDVVSDMDMPPFDKSAMDGYACRRADLENELTVLETIPAGTNPAHKIGADQCSKIMTGAMVPEGADCVIMVEHTEEVLPGTIRFTRDSTRDNICILGEDVREGDCLIRKGSLVSARDIAVMASSGCAMPLVSRRPRVGVIATGSELVDPAEKPEGSKIRNSNSYQLCAQVTDAGCEPVNFGVAGDTADLIAGAIGRARDRCDLVIVSGGVSMGDYDLVPGMLKQNGFELAFEKIAIKPGKPTVFGTGDATACFGLPGNPVSTYVIFELLVKPFLYGLMGHEFRPPVVVATLVREVKRRKTGRDAWLPVLLNEKGEATPVEYHGSAHITALARADGLISMPSGVREIPGGKRIDVRSL